jgi:hypothetical protein
MADETEMAPIGGASEQTVGTVGEAPAPEAEAERPEAMYYYHAAENAHGEYFVGVPQRDLTEAEVKAYPKWIQKALKGSKFYLTEPATTEPVEEDQ